MNLEDAANIAQLVGTFAVLVSLIFVIVQIRHAAREVLATAQQAQANAHADYLMRLATDPVLEKFLANSLGGERQLSPVEIAQQGFYLNAVFLQFQAAFHGARQLDEADRRSWVQLERALARWMRSPVVQTWWQNDRELFADDFRAAIEAIEPVVPPNP